LRGRRFIAGAFLDLLLPWYHFSIAASDRPLQSEDWTSFQGAAGLSLQYLLTRKFALTAEGAAHLASARKIFRRVSDQSDILTTPWVTVDLTAGFSWLWD